MKKLVLSILVILGFMTFVNAQNSPLKDYVGKYVFGANNLGINESMVELNENTLKVSSVMGTFVLEKKGVDTFAITEHGATVVFKRDANKNIESVYIAVAGMELEGKKEVVASTSGTKEEELVLPMLLNKELMLAEKWSY